MRHYQIEDQVAVVQNNQLLGEVKFIKSIEMRLDESDLEFWDFQIQYFKRLRKKLLSMDDFEKA